MPSLQVRSRRRAGLGAGVVVLVLAAIVVALVALTDSGGQPSTSAASPSTGPADGFAQVVKAASPSVVQSRSWRGLGSGIVFDRAGHIVTNAHVVAGSTSFQVTAADGSTHAATLRGVFPQGDLAVVEVSGAELP